jgi:flagellar biogenesis protein FliO
MATRPTAQWRTQPLSCMGPILCTQCALAFRCAWVRSRSPLVNFWRQRSIRCWCWNVHETTSTTRTTALRNTSSPAMGSMGYLVWLLVVGAAIALLWAVRSQRGAGLGWLKARPGEHKTVLNVLGTRPLGPGSSLQVVRWGGKEFLLGCTPQSIQVLDSRALPDPAPAEIP